MLWGEKKNPTLWHKFNGCICNVQITPHLKSKNVETVEDPKWAPMLLMVFHEPSK